MIAQPQPPIEFPIGNISKGHLTSATFGSVFDAFLNLLPKIRSHTSSRIDLKAVEWIDHLPLLSVCLLLSQCARFHLHSCEVIMPAIPERESFLERWGLFRLLDELGIAAELSNTQGVYEEAELSRVLPITRFMSVQGAGIVRDSLLKAEGNLREVLLKQACLEEPDVSGLADLIIFELCKNVVDHSRCESGGFAVAHASRPSVIQAAVRNRSAAPWEKEFYERIGEEGITEIVVGDAGIGIVESLRSAARESGAVSAQQILQYAFEPYSTSRQEKGRKTRGLWCVKQKVRDFGGLLYVRSCSAASSMRALSGQIGTASKDIPPAGVAAYWDFLNHPDRAQPQFAADTTWFPGTQLQILLPQRSHDRPRTYVALHLQEGPSKRSAAKPFAVPQKPPLRPIGDAVRKAIRDLGTDEVLFIDMSAMQTSWTREAIDELTAVLCVELVRGQQRRIWLLNPSERTVNLMRVSESILHLWREQAVMIPVVYVTDLSRPPKVFPVLSDPEIRSESVGDSKEARKRLISEVWLAVEDAPRSVRVALADLDGKERSWLQDVLSRNYAIIHTKRRKGQEMLVPEFDIQALTRTAGMMLLRTELQSRVTERLIHQAKGGPRWFRLTSGVHCKEYIDDRILYDIAPWLRNRIDCWIEERVENLQPQFVVSYTELGNALLARGLESRREAKAIHLGNYLDIHGPDGLTILDQVSRGDLVVLLVDISGSGKTIEKLIEYLQARGAKAHLVCLIDTISPSDRKRRRRLDDLYNHNQVDWLVRHPIDKVDRLPTMGPQSTWPVSSIDPFSLLPIPEVSDSEKLISDGEFWGLIARTGTLSTTPITYKGHEFGSFIWLTGLFKDYECARRIAGHLLQCIGGGRPEKVLVTEATVEFLPKNAALHNLLSVEYKEGLWLEGESNPLDDHALQNKKVVIFSAASTSGSGIARLLKMCGLASHVHICTFVNRMSNDIASAFVQKHGVTFSTFQRLYSASPSLRQRGYRTAAMRNLGKYRRSCLSNRLLLFVEEEITSRQQAHTFLESPTELSDSSEILTAPFTAEYLANHANYDLLTPVGQKAIEHLIHSWDPNHELTVLKAILEEASCRYEAAVNKSDPDHYRSTVMRLYSSANKSQMPGRMRELVLSAMFLEKLPGERVKASQPAAKFYALLWADFIDAIKHDEFGLSAACLRACAKLEPIKLIENLGEAVSCCARSRLTELTLSLELSKMRDDAHLQSAVLDALQQIVLKLASKEQAPTRESVALEDQLRDLGLIQCGDSVLPMKWSEISRILATQPPDPARTVRAAIRTLRHTLPNCTIEYFRQLEQGRFIIADGWPPPRQLSGPAFPVQSNFTHRLIGADGKFFTPDLASDHALEAQQLFKRMLEVFADLENKSVGLFLAQLTSGIRSSEAARRPVLGILRVQVISDKETPPGISAEQHKMLIEIADGACELLGRPEATHVAKIGAWQYEHAVSGLGQAKLASLERQQTLRVIADLMLELLEADLGRVAVHIPQCHMWKSGPLSGTRWEGSRKHIEIGDDDERSATVKAARNGRPEIIPDVQKAGRSLPPNDWVHGCIALPLVLESGKCDTVITLWHHVVDWFSQFDASLLESLAAIGGALVQQVQAIELRTAQEQRHTIQTVSRHLAHTIKNRLPERPFKDLLNQVPEPLRPLAKACLTKVKKISSMRRRFMHLAEMDTFSSDGPHTAAELFSRLEPCLKEISLLFCIEIKSCSCERFDQLIVCNRDFLEDDLLELLHNTETNAKQKDLRHVEVTFALRLATREDLAQSPFLKEAEGKLPYVVVEFADNGGGILQANKGQIFDEKKEERNKEQGSESLGLGLPLARRLARKLGGDMVECGVPGAGARFLILFRTTS